MLYQLTGGGRGNPNKTTAKTLGLFLQIPFSIIKNIKFFYLMQFGAWEDVWTGLLYSVGKTLLSNAAPVLSYAAPLLSYATPLQYVFTGTYG